jgi:hypothetical protein
MPKMNPNIKSWRRGVRLNQKRHIDMTDEEKANIAHCSGIKNEHTCKNPVFRCSECGNYGCSQDVLNKCTEQGFKGDKCLNCSVTESLIPVMKDELPALIAQWAKNDL